MANEPSPHPRPLAAYYDEHYYAHYSHDADTPYRRGEPVWMSFFGEISRQIVVELAPTTVLDAGCAMGLLVEALRERGVDARGLDLSSYAVSQVRDDVRQYCRVGSITEELDRDFDLITCIEVLEHLPPQDAEVAVANISRHTECVLFSSTPDDYGEPTHLNVQPSDYWVGLFARYGFFRDLDFDAYFVSGHAILLRKIRGAPTAVIRAYERRYWQTAVEKRELRAARLESSEAQATLAAEISYLKTERELLSQEVMLRTGERAPRRAHSLRTWRRGVQALVRRALGAGRRTSVLFIAGGTDTSRRYRCDHQAEALRLLGWQADVIHEEDASLASALDGYDAYIVHRVPFRPQIEWFMQRAREMGKPLVYDTGGCAFDPRLADSDRAKHAVWRNRQTLDRADAVLVATEPLQQLAARLHTRVYVAPDAVSQSMLRCVEAGATRQATGHDRDTVRLTIVGYPDRSARDFVEAAVGVRWALEVYPDIRLLVVGRVELPDDFANFGNRVERTPYRSWHALQNMAAFASINLAPRESGNPCSIVESCVEYLEAGVCRVPTVASSTPDFARVIRPGDNGFLADSSDSWKEALKVLIESVETRNGAGARAREDILGRHTTAARGHHLQAILNGLLIEHSAVVE